MNKVTAAIALALAFAAAPSVAIAGAPAVVLGMAFYSEDSRLNPQVNVALVKPGGIAELMGVRPGDVVTHAGGKRMTSDQKLTGYIRNLKVGDAIELTVKRSGKALQLTGRATSSGS